MIRKILFAALMILGLGTSALMIFYGISSLASRDRGRYLHCKTACAPHPAQITFDGCICDMTKEVR